MWTVVWWGLAWLFLGMLLALALAPLWARNRTADEIDAIRREVFEDKQMAAGIRQAFSEYDFTAWEEEMSK